MCFVKHHSSLIFRRVPPSTIPKSIFPTETSRDQMLSGGLFHVQTGIFDNDFNSYSDPLDESPYVIGVNISAANKSRKRALHALT
jgi:hypothetical protein